MVSTMVIGPGMVILSLRLVWARACRASAWCTRPFSFSAPVTTRHHRLVAVGADAHLDLVGEVDAVDEFEKAVHEMLARLLAVADDVDAGVLLQLDREQRGVELGRRELVALQPPLRPQLVRLGEPGGFRQAAGDGRRKQHVYAGLETLWRPPTIKPIVARAQLFSAHTSHRQIAHEGLGPVSP